jgi:hypothetical protein
VAEPYATIGAQPLARAVGASGGHEIAHPPQLIEVNACGDITVGEDTGYTAHA